MFRLHIMLDFKQITEIDGLNVHISFKIFEFE